MAQRTHGDDQDRATEPKFYLPAGVSPSSEASWFEKVGAALFNHRV